MHYRFEGKAFKALAFANNQGGYEMRSTGRFKGTSRLLEGHYLAACGEKDGGRRGSGVRGLYGLSLGARLLSQDGEAETPVISFCAEFGGDAGTGHARHSRTRRVESPPVS